MPDDGIQQLERGGFDAILLGTVGDALAGEPQQENQRLPVAGAQCLNLTVSFVVTTKLRNRYRDVGFSKVINCLNECWRRFSAN